MIRVPVLWIRTARLAAVMELFARPLPEVAPGQPPGWPDARSGTADPENAIRKTLRENRDPENADLGIGSGNADPENRPKDGREHQ